MRLTDRLDQLSRARVGAQILHEPVVGQDLHLVMGERDGQEGVGFRTRRALLARHGAYVVEALPWPSGSTIGAGRPER